MLGKRRTRKRTGKSKKSDCRTAGLVSGLLSSTARVVGDPHCIEPAYSESAVSRFARQNRRRPTRSEIRLEGLLRSLNGGVLIGRYVSQHPLSGRWIVDFFFPEVRLAIEVDGPYHNSEGQRVRDREKELDCQRFDITLLRLSNAEVWGSQRALTEKLRQYWRKARHRPNGIIGKSFEEYCRLGDPNGTPD